MGTDIEDGGAVVYSSHYEIKAAAKPIVPQSGLGKWILVTRVDYSPTPGALARREISDKQAEEIKPILRALEKRKNCAPGMMLPLDEVALKKLAPFDLQASGRAIIYVQLEKEAPQPAVQRNARVVPIILIVMMVASVLPFVFTRQGVDLILQGEDRLWSAILVCVSLVLIPSVLTGGILHSLGVLDEGASDDLDALGVIMLFLALITGFFATMIIFALWPSWLLLGFLWLPFFWVLFLAIMFLSMGAMSAPRFSVPAAVLLLIAIGIWPAPIGNLLGSMLTLGIILAAWTFLLTGIVHWYRRAPSSKRGFWVSSPKGANAPQDSYGPSGPTIKLFGFFVALIMLGLVVQLIFVGSPRDMIRGTPRVTALTPFDKAYDQLIARQRSKGEAPVIVIVAAAGGGIKASYWTAKVLAQATDIAPQLRDDLFVASGVSGGSLGLALYQALLKTGSPVCEVASQAGKAQPGQANPGPLETCAEAFHRYDLLAGVIGAFGTTSVVNTLLPIFPQRSVAIEKTWELRWRDAVKGPHGAAAPDLFRQPFLQLWTQDRATPALVLNTTRALTGDRIVASNLDLSGIFTTKSVCTANIAQQIDLPLSAAANASARFPIVEPLGWFPVATPPAGCNPSEAIADGGFYDNYGAATALDVYESIKTLEMRRKEAAKNGKRPYLGPRILVIQISSDTECRLAIGLDRDGGIKRASECQQRRDKRKKEFAIVKPPQARIFGLTIPKWLWNPVRPFENTRSTRSAFYPDPDKQLEPPGMIGTELNATSVTGLAVAKQLRDRVRAGKDEFFYFSLGGALDIPLGWALSRHSRGEIDGQLASGENASEMKAFIEALAVRPMPSVATVQTKESKR